MTQHTTDNWHEVQARSKAVLPDRLVKLIESHKGEEHSQGNLIEVLHAVQGHFGYLGREHLDAVAQLLQVPAATVTGVATFYHFFRLRPQGRYIINVCMGTACYVKGASAVADRIKTELDIDFGESTSDGVFSLVASRCIGTCGLAPVVMIGEEVFPKVRPDQVPGMLDKYRQKATQAPDESTQERE